MPAAGLVLAQGGTLVLGLLNIGSASQCVCMQGLFWTILNLSVLHMRFLARTYQKEPLERLVAAVADEEAFELLVEARDTALKRETFTSVTTCRVSQDLLTVFLPM